ncbi:MAG: hypothetical protein ABR978_04615 [Dehalococcoidia bacterium]
MPPRRRTATNALLDRLDKETEVFSRDLTREYYLNGAGLKEELSLAPIFDQHAQLFAEETVAAIRRADSEDPRFSPLRAFVIEGYLENAAKGLSETLAARETADTTTWQEREVPYRTLPVLTANEPDAERRHEIDALRIGLTAAQNSLREERWDIVQATARKLGYPHYVALCDDVGRLGLERLREQVTSFLWRSDGRYRSLLWRYLDGIGVAPASAERSDLAYLFRSPQFDSQFPAERLLPSLTDTLRGLGIDLDAQRSVRLDTEARPLKSPRAFCAAIDIPDEVMLVINPHGGQDDYSALLHEAGHAEHFAHADRRLPFALRGLGDNSVTEGYAFILEHLMQNPAWLERYLGWSDSGEFVAFKQFHKLYIWRRYCVKLIYELELHTADNPRSKAKRYCDLLTSSLGVRYNPADYLFDVDDGFYCARYLRAWMFEAQLRRHLQGEFGQEWFLRREAGARLIDLWSLGQSLPVEEFARKAGYAGLELTPLEQELTA